MNNQDKRVLTPKVAQELIQELFIGQTVQRQQIIKKVDEVHKERGGLSPTARVHHPAEHALMTLKKLGLANNFERGIWSFFSPKPSETESSEEQSNIKTLDQFMEWARKFERGKYVFRGVPNEVYGIQASVYRRPEEKKRNFERFLQINQDLIREARLRGYDEKDGQKLKELEVLADLQRCGAATCLIDFTHNAQVALWFACDRDYKNPEEFPDGKVYAISNQPPKFKEITPALLKEDIGYFLKDGEESQLYHWQPHQQNHRIIVQQSIFLFGYYEFDADDVCIIDEGSKQDILVELKKVSEITKDSLFPDFEGFARVRSEEVLYTELTFSEFKEQGILAHEGKNYKDAIANFDKALNLNDTDHELHYLRGKAKYYLSLFSEAIEDYTTAIRLNPNEMDYHYALSWAYYRIKQFDEAKKSFDHIIALAPDNARSHRRKGRLCYHTGDYKEAINCYDHAIDLETNDAFKLLLYCWRGEAKYNVARYSEAAEDFTLAINLNPEYQKPYRWLSMAKIGQGKLWEAYDDLQIALQLAKETNDTARIDRISQDVANLRKKIEKK